MTRRLDLRIAVAAILETDSGAVYRLGNQLYIAPPEAGLTWRQWARLLVRTWFIPYGCG